MRNLPELGNIIIFLAIFLVVFVASNVTARGAGYRE